MEDWPAHSSGSTTEQRPCLNPDCRGRPHAKVPRRQARNGNSDRFCTTLPAVLSVMLDSAIEGRPRIHPPRSDTDHPPRGGTANTHERARSPLATAPHPRGRWEHPPAPLPSRALRPETGRAPEPLANRREVSSWQFGFLSGFSLHPEGEGLFFASDWLRVQSHYYR